MGALRRFEVPFSSVGTFGLPCLSGLPMTPDARGRNTRESPSASRRAESDRFPHRRKKSLIFLDPMGLFSHFQVSHDRL
jgi:hypothetical protein